MAGEASHRPATIVVGLGNPILGDDGVGWRVVDEVERRLSVAPRARDGAGAGRLDRPFVDPSAVALERVALGGLALMELLVGYRRAILVDALVTGAPAGTIHCLPLADVAERAGAHLDSAHDAPLGTALAAGRSLGADLPGDVVVVGVEAEPSFDFSERLSPPVEDAVAGAAERVLDLLAAGP